MNPIYIKNYINTPNELLNELLDLDWEQRVNVRKEYFMGLNNDTYVYSNRTYIANPFIKSVRDILDKLNHDEFFDILEEYTVCFLNRYDTQHDSLGWHSDAADTVAVISLGSEREIWWKEPSYKGIIPNSQKQKLENGSLFLMPFGFQKLYLHRIPKHDKPCGTRISLTFRRL